MVEFGIVNFTGVICKTVLGFEIMIFVRVFQSIHFEKLLRNYVEFAFQIMSRIIKHTCIFPTQKLFTYQFHLDGLSTKLKLNPFQILI